MRRAYVVAPDGRLFDATPLPRWLRFCIRHRIPCQRANQFAMTLRRLWDGGA